MSKNISLGNENTLANINGLIQIENVPESIILSNNSINCLKSNWKQLEYVARLQGMRLRIENLRSQIEQDRIFSVLSNYYVDGREIGYVSKEQETQGGFYGYTNLDNGIIRFYVQDFKDTNNGTLCHFTVFLNNTMINIMDFGESEDSLYDMKIHVYNPVNEYVSTELELKADRISFTLSNIEEELLMFHNRLNRLNHNISFSTNNTPNLKENVVLEFDEDTGDFKEVSYFDMVGKRIKKATIHYDKSNPNIPYSGFIGEIPACDELVPVDTNPMSKDEVDMALKKIFTSPQVIYTFLQSLDNLKNINFYLYNHILERYGKIIEVFRNNIYEYSRGIIK